MAPRARWWWSLVKFVFPEIVTHSGLHHDSDDLEPDADAEVDLCSDQSLLALVHFHYSN